MNEHPAQNHSPDIWSAICQGRRAIRARFQEIKSTDLGLARAWREHTRTLFEAAFAAGYTVVDLLFEDEQSCYLLEKNWAPR